MTEQQNDPRKQAQAIQQAQREELQAATKLREALIRANYHVEKFGGGSYISLDGIDKADKKEIEPVLKAWLAKAEATDKLLPAQEQHTKHNFSQQTMTMVQTYFKKNHITVDDAVLGDEYKQVLAHAAKKPSQGHQK